MREVEGGNRNWLMRILRHEAGHAVDSAYRLRRLKSWREAFGPASLPYPDTYRPRPGSRRFVQHLGAWYAQAHPTEDFAETFAVWLKPHSTWRREYVGWPAYAKLQYIDELAQEIGQQKPLIANRSTIEDVTHETGTLREHYEQKLARYRLPRRSGADELLLKVFTTAPRTRATPKAASVLRELRTPLRQQIQRSGAFSEYLVHQVLRLMILRCEALNLYVRGSRRELKGQLLWVVARLAESYEERKLPRVAL
jgi:Putative zinc-binding metallo-peptidase